MPDFSSTCEYGTANVFSVLKIHLVRTEDAYWTSVESFFCFVGVFVVFQSHVDDLIVQAFGFHGMVWLALVWFSWFGLVWFSSFGWLVGWWVGLVWSGLVFVVGLVGGWFGWWLVGWLVWLV